jgi:hypothetical protein
VALCGGAVFYFSSANADSNLIPGDRGGAPLPVLPEANAGLALIPGVTAVLMVFCCGVGFGPPDFLLPPTSSRYGRL